MTLFSEDAMELQALRAGWKEKQEIIEKQDAELESARAEIERKMSAGQFVIEQLAAEQAKNVGLRQALEDIKWHRKPGGCPSKYEYEVEVIADKALASPSDTSALETVVKKAGEVMREKCSSICKDEANDAFADGEAEDWGRAAVMCSELISSLPAVTLEDLK